VEGKVKRLQQRLFLGILILSIPTTASAGALGLKFAATDPDAATSSLGPAEVAGVVPQANWNNLTGATGTDVGSLVRDDGGASSATVSWAGPNTWRSTTGNNAFPDGPNRKLTAGYLDSNNTAAGGAMVTVNNIDAAIRAPAYNVYVYFVGDSAADRGGAYTLTPSVGSPIVKYGSTLAMPSAFIEDPGTDADNTLDGTHLVFRGLTAPSFSIASNTELTTPNGFRAPINAIQIVAVPEPTSVMLTCGAAIAAALAWRRRRC
jgi:hypothetical protein